MAKAKKLSLFERGRVAELHKQGLSQRAITAEVGSSKTVIWNFLNDPEGYGTSQVEDPNKNFTSTEPEDPIGCPSRHWTILDPN